MRTAPKNLSRSRPLETTESLTVKIKAYESLIANAEIRGRGELPHVELLQRALSEMKTRLQALEIEGE